MVGIQALLLVASMAANSFSSLEANLLRAKALDERAGGAETPLISFPIVDSLFRLSPGDQVSLRWWGVGQGDDVLTVDPQGRLVLPELGAVHVQGLTFDKVRDSVEAILRRTVRPRVVDLQVRFVQPASIGVSGVAPHPGVHVLPAGGTLLDLVAAAGWDVAELMRISSARMPRDDAPEARLPSLRRIQIVRGGGKDSADVDLARIIRQGRVEQVVRLFSGDRVVFRPQNEIVAVSGQASATGYQEFLPGEPLSAFLESIGADAGVAGGEATGENGDTRRIQLADPIPAGTKALRLDLAPPRAVAAMAWIEGLVRHPGVYAISPGTKAEDLVVQAGGLRLPRDSVVVVAVKHDWPHLQAGRIPGIEGSIQYMEVRQALAGYQLVMRGNYSAANPEIQAGDTVKVHRIQSVVWVAGRVGRPGFVPWIPGATVDDYVRSAGGYADRAWKSKAEVFDLFTQQLSPASEIRPGSAIVVPERRYIYPENWVTIMATVLSLVAVTFSLFIQVRSN